MSRKIPSRQRYSMVRKRQENQHDDLLSTTKPIVRKKVHKVTLLQQKVERDDKEKQKTSFDKSPQKKLKKSKTKEKMTRLKRWQKITLSILSFVILASALFIGFIYIKFQSAIKSISTNNLPEASSVSDVSMTPFNILFIGIGSNGEDDEAPLADSINLFSVNPRGNYVEAIAIPRDSYVPFGEACVWGIGYFDKITHTTGISPECLQTTLEHTLGIDINYYVSVDFKGFIKIVDALGGIEMDVPDFVDEFMALEDPKLKEELRTGTQWCEHSSKRKRYRVCFDEFGKQKVDGEHALALARTRRFDGDAQRNLRQTAMIKAIVSKAVSVNTLFNADKLIDAVAETVATNIPPNQFFNFFELAQKMFLGKTGNELQMRTTQLAGFDGTFVGDRIGEYEAYYRLVPTGSLYNISHKIGATIRTGEVVISPETFDFEIPQEETYLEDLPFWGYPTLDEIYDYENNPREY